MANKKKKKNVAFSKARKAVETGIWLGNKEAGKMNVANIQYIYDFFYLKDAYEFTVKDDYWTNPAHIVSNEDDELYPKVVDRITEYFNRDKNWPMIKVYSNSHSVYFRIYPSDEMDNMIIVKTDEFVEEYDFILHRVLMIDTVTKLDAISGLCEDGDQRIGYSPKERTHANIQILNDGISKYIEHYSIYTILYEALGKFLDDWDKDNIVLTANHIPIELKMFKHTIKMASDNEYINTTHGMYALNMILENGNPEYPNRVYETASNNVLTCDKMSIDIMENMLYQNDIPIIDLSDRDWSYIKDYMVSKNYLYTDEPIINLDAKLESQRYGYTFDHTLDKKKSGYISCIPWSEDNICRLIFRHKIPEDKMNDGYIITMVDITHLNELSITNDTEMTYMQLIMVRLNDANDLPKSVRDRDNLVPVELRDMDGIRKHVQRLISLHATISDRPDMLCGSSVPRPRRGKKTEEDKYDKPKHSSGKSIQYITRKVYDRKESSDPIERKDAEYSIPEWQRMGYWRTYKKTGKKVWIKPGICKRRLPITKEREVHIKL